MEITLSKAKGRMHVDIINLNGDLDAASYKDLIEAAKQLYDGGARQLVLDMADLKFVSSAGLAALHIITKMFRGEEAPDPEEGWNTFREMDRDRDIGAQRNVKLLSPSDQILEVLDVVGFKPLYEIFADLDKAVQSF